MSFLTLFGNQRNVGSIAQLFPSNSIFDVDATIAASYNGGQYLNNLVSSPADGSTQAAYRFTLGATSGSSTDDPTFTGSVGSPSAYFLYDGGDQITLDGAVTSCALLNTVHQKLDHTLILCLNHLQSSSADCGLFSTTDTYNSSNVGISYYGGWSNLFYRQRVTATLVSANRATSPNTAIDRIIMLSYDGTGNTVTSYVNSSTGNSTAMSYTVTASAHVGTKPAIGAIGTTSKLPNGSRVYGCAMLNKTINSAEAAQIISFYNARHRRIYA